MIGNEQRIITEVTESIRPVANVIVFRICLLTLPMMPYRRYMHQNTSLTHYAAFLEDGVKLPKVENGRLRYLTPAELKKVLQNAPDWMRAPLALAVLTGCRRGELLSLRWDDVNLEQKVIFIPDTKNGEPKAVPLNSLAVEVLESLPETDDLVLPDVDAARLSVETKRLFKRVGIKDASFHTLRHTAASWLVMQGADLYGVGQLLGHKTLKMTKRYAHLSPGYMQAVAGKLDVAFKGMLPEVTA